MQFMVSYEAWVELFGYLHESWQGDGLISIAQNVFALGKSKKVKFDGSFFCSFSCAYWAHHMKWLHRIDKLAKIFGHSSPLMLVRLMLVLDDLQ